MSTSSQPPPIPREVLSFREGCEYLQLSERTCWGLVSNGTLPHFKAGKQIRFFLDDLRDWIRAQTANRAFDAAAREERA